MGAAVELMELIDDDPGRANEALLDDARNALVTPYDRIPTDFQEAAGAGAVVAFEAEPEARAAAVELIDDAHTRRWSALERLRDRLVQKLRRCRRRRRAFPTRAPRSG